MWPPTREFRVWDTPHPKEKDLYNCGSYSTTATLLPGEAIDLVTLPLRTPYALPTGVYYLRAHLDPIDQILEQREDSSEVPLPHKKLYVGPRPTGSE